MIVCADVLDWAANYDGQPFHALLCDPPYHLYEDRRGVTRYNRGMKGWKEQPELYNRTKSRGFMGKSWDGGGIAFHSDTWAALAQHLHPGAFGMAFASARGWHRLACAIEDAGLRIHPSIMGWVAGSGFPKATKIERDSAANLFCQCESSQRLFPEHDIGNSGLDGMNTGADCQVDCRQDPHSYDAQPRPEPDTARDVEPSTADVLAHSHSAAPSVQTWAGSVPSHNPSRALRSDHQTKRDCQSRDGCVSQSPLASIGETYPDHGSILASKDGNGDRASSQAGKGDGKAASHNPHIHNSDVGSSVQPPPRIRNHNTTEGPRCQICGKVKRGVWEGHRYGLQSMKPAVEMIIVFQKPYQGKPVECITATGAGAVWIEGSRIGTETLKEQKAGQAQIGTFVRQDMVTSERNGRWPANFYTQHHPDCRRVGERRVRGSSGVRIETTGDSTRSKTGGLGIEGGRPVGFETPGYADPDGLETITAWSCVESCPVRALGEQSGERPAGARTGTGHPKYGGNSYLNSATLDTTSCEASTGTAARFFFQSHWAYEVQEQIDAADPVCYCAKASRSERDAGLGEWERYEIWRYNQDGRDPSNPANVMGAGAKARIQRGESAVIPSRNPHPTVKPIALARWLATLLLPPAEYAPRRLLVPFAGSGSEMIGAGLVGWEHILGIELDSETCEIARARIAHWLSEPKQLELI